MYLQISPDGTVNGTDNDNDYSEYIFLLTKKFW